MITPLSTNYPDVVAVRATGTLNHNDYEEFRREIENKIRQFGKVRVLMELEDFHGWDLQSAWDDLKLGFQHFNQIEACALVGDRSWENWMIKLAKPFFRVQYFDRLQRDEAWQWLMQPVAACCSAGSFLGKIGSTIRQHPLTTALLVGGAAVLLVYLTGGFATRQLSHSSTS
jgi:hypothetical protein